MAVGILDLLGFLFGDQTDPDFLHPGTGFSMGSVYQICCATPNALIILIFSFTAAMYS